MTDIVERLRRIECEVDALKHEAAHAIKQRDAVIERLRAALRDVRETRAATPWWYRDRARRALDGEG
jgi:predicted transcriptional regulator